MRRSIPILIALAVAGALLAALAPGRAHAAAPRAHAASHTCPAVASVYAKGHKAHAVIVHPGISCATAAAVERWSNRHPPTAVDPANGIACFSGHAPQTWLYACGKEAPTSFTTYFRVYAGR